MVAAKSLDEYKVIVAMLRDAHASHGVVFNATALRLTILKIEKRMLQEGLGFLTKTMHRLGKAFDKALAGNMKMTAKEVGFKPYLDSELPRFLGEFFITIFQQDGTLLPNPDATSVGIVRQLTSFGKYKLKYNGEQEQQVLAAFKQAEKDLSDVDSFFALCNDPINLITIDSAARSTPQSYLHSYKDAKGVDLRPLGLVVRDARQALNRLFLHFDPLDIDPRHGPGSVATRQQYSGKYRWTNISGKITSSYPIDAYFYASLGHVCDTYRDFSKITDKDLPARVLLVPKDSRGPRLISCEPVDYQWIQGGLGRAIVRHVESHPLTKGHVNFTDQGINRDLALKSSITLSSATIDLKEASDRIHTDLVRLLFPSNLVDYLLNCRSSSTRLPDGEVLKLKKYAPMGSALCFPVLSLITWALLIGTTDNADIRKNIFVYGDDVIVPQDHVLSAMTQLESFGLKVNRDKSCYAGFFRESCGMDAFKGVDVTPVRFRTVWAETPSPSTYTSWIAYANSFYDKGWMSTFREIRTMLTAVFGSIPGDDMFPHGDVPTLRQTHTTERSFRSRWNPHLQRREFYVRHVHSAPHTEASDGWSLLLRYFADKANSSNRVTSHESESALKCRCWKCTASRDRSEDSISSVPFSASQYTKRHAAKLRWGWR
jgi:hypothetical protein